MVRLTTPTCFLLIIAIIATSSNARSARYNIDDENDAAELLNSLREDVQMYRRSCVRHYSFSGYASCGSFLGIGNPCCGSNNLYCSHHDGVSYCDCAYGNIPNSDGTDCTPVGAPCNPNGPAYGNPNMGCANGYICWASDLKCHAVAATPAPPTNQPVGAACGANGVAYNVPNFGCATGLVCWAADLKCHSSG